MDNPRVIAEVIGEIFGAVVKHEIRAIHETLNRMETKMAAIDDELAAVQATQANSDALITKVGADVTTLLGLIGQVPTAGLSTAQQAALDDIAAHAGKINDALTAVDASAQPAAPPATPPAA